MENSNDTIRNQTHDLLACSTVPQPTAPLRAPSNEYIVKINNLFSVLIYLYFHRIYYIIMFLLATYL